MITYKIRYKNYLVDVYVPEQSSGRSVLLLPGLPISSNLAPILKPFLDAGAVVFYPYFSGSHDSYGTYSPNNAISDLRRLYPLLLSESVRELYFGKNIPLPRPKEVILTGMSYGAGIALHGHASLFDKVILLSPALLFNQQDIGGKEGVGFSEQMHHLLSLLKHAHPLTYRTRFSQGLRRYLLGNDARTKRTMVLEALNTTTKPTLVVHGNNDTSIPVSITQSLEANCTNGLVLWKYVQSGHSTSSYPPEAMLAIQDFVKQKVAKDK